MVFLVTHRVLCYTHGTVISTQKQLITSSQYTIWWDNQYRNEINIQKRKNYF